MNKNTEKNFSIIWNKGFSIAKNILVALFLSGPIIFETIISTPYVSKNRYKALYTAIYNLEKNKYIKREKNEDEKILIKLTKKGYEKALMLKIKSKKNEHWDKKWRIIIFDVPEKHRNQRDFLRFLLKNFGFYKLQQSVWITPYKIEEEIKKWLSDKEYSKFIRFFIAETINNADDIKKYFSLK